MPRPHTLVFIALLVAGTLGACSKTAEEPGPQQTPAPAVAATANTANVQAFRIGELAAMSLRDGDLEMPNDNQVFGVGLKPEDVAAVLSAAGLPTGQLTLSLHPLLVKAADRVLLFDAGAGALMGSTAGKLPAALDEAGVDPASVTDIFISHSHGDHIGGLVNGAGALTFPNAAIHVSKPEWDFLAGQQDMAALVTAIKPKVDAFTPGAELVPGVVSAVEIKGHTPGHSGYKITSGTDSLLYVGDSMHHSVVSVQKPEWTIQFDGDNAVGTASRMALIDELAASGQRVFAVHFPFPGVGKIEKRGDGAVWVAE